MLKTNLLHPEILSALGSNGHGAKVLIADSNFPISTCSPASAKKVYLNFAPGILKATEVLKTLKDYISIEEATVMMPSNQSFQSIHKEFETILGMVPLKKVKRFEFYETSKNQ